MKSIIKCISLIIATVTLAMVVCSCSYIKTSMMTVNERADFLIAEANKQWDMKKQHTSYDITINVDYGGEKYTQKIKFHHYFDSQDPKNTKIRVDQSLNELEGCVTDYTYVDGICYITSEDSKQKFETESATTANYFIPLYPVYYRIGGAAYVDCPVRENGQYTLKLTHTSTSSRANMYDYLVWALPYEIYEAMYTSSFTENYIFDSDYRILQKDNHIELKPILHGEKGRASIDYQCTYHYDDFTISAPKDAKDHTLIENHAYRSNISNGMNNLLKKSTLDFSVSYDLALSGAINDSYNSKELFNCKTLSNRPNFSQQTESVASGIASTYNSYYDGTNYVTVGDGFKQETPLSQEDAYYYIESHIDYLGVKYNIESIDSVTKSDDGTVIYFTLFDDVANEMVLWYGYGIDFHPDDITSSTNACKVYIDKSGTIASVECTARVIFDYSGEQTTADFKYKMNH